MDKETKNPYRRINDCFKKSDTIRAQHVLFDDFKQERTDVMKFTFYLWLGKNELQTNRGKDENGNLGFGLEYIPKQISNG